MSFVVGGFAKGFPRYVSRTVGFVQTVTNPDKRVVASDGSVANSTRNS